MANNQIVPESKFKKYADLGKKISNLSVDMSTSKGTANIYNSEFVNDVSLMNNLVREQNSDSRKRPFNLDSELNNSLSTSNVLVKDRYQPNTLSKTINKGYKSNKKLKLILQRSSNQSILQTNCSSGRIIPTTTSNQKEQDLDYILPDISHSSMKLLANQSAEILNPNQEKDQSHSE